MKVAIVHDWLNGMRGGEHVLEALLEIWPEAGVFALFCEPDRVSPAIRSRVVATSFLDRVPGARRSYRYLLPLLPGAIASLDLGRPDIVISSSHAVAKGAPAGDALHVCYCHTPMRYIWDAEAEYRPGPLARIGLALVREPLRRWDRSTAARVDHFVANSRFVAGRIQSYYGRHATVIPPPVDTALFTPPHRDQGYYLWAGALVPYKRPDLAVDAFTRNGKPFVVAGTGPEAGRLARRAGPNVRFRGWVSPVELRDLYRGARALVFPGREDAGIVPVEARACGCPVIAFDGGGAVESLDDGVNAVLFGEQTVPELERAIRRFESIEWSDSSVCRGTASFSRERFKSEMESFVRRCWDAARPRRGGAAPAPGR